MRIKSGGPNRARGAQKASKAKKSSKAKFSGVLEEKVDTEEKAREIRNALMDELIGLADEMKSGKATKEETSRKFAGLVIRDRFGEQGDSKGGARMEETIGDLVEDDPVFVSRLQTQLKKIAKS
jgi:hypothetical protein